MNQPLAAALGLVLAATLATAVPPSYADEPLPIPTITSPTQEEPVGNEVTVAATASGAPYGLFELRHSYDQAIRHAPVTSGPDGTFTDTLPTKGLGSIFHVTARACRTSSVDSCHDRGAELYLRRTPLPAVTTGEGWRDVVDTTTVGTVPVVVPDTAGLDVFLYTPKGRFAATPAGPRQIDVAGIEDGYTSVGIGQCSDLNPDVCTKRGIRFLVRRAPHASFVWHDSVISQNRDGICDTARYQLRLDPDLPVLARWRVLSGSTTVVGPIDYSTSEVAQARQLGGIQLAADHWQPLAVSCLPPTISSRSR
ncbi:hypothetical protein [Nocardioides speluncae]|uniref:hypothetical protein n=1 Tax=Nocardioides speluncae TaxID=2670337 RepID=UPI000D69E98E|nr:hypothetical protein [Nocardioides speluncae]